MLAAQRQTMILEYVGKLGAARISELADSLDVSEMTVRRDIDTLAEQGLVDKVHGGATAILEHSPATEPPFKSKSLREQVTKDAIAAKAAELVQPGAAIAMMGGSSVFAMSRHIKDIPRLTVVTNSLPVSDYLHSEGRSDQTVILAGGMRTPTDSLVGEIAIQTFDKVNVDIVFMGTHGMDVRGGYSSPNLFESETNLAIRSRAKRLVVLADHTKWGQVGSSTFAKLSDADVLITDSGLEAEALAELKQHVNQVLLASAELENISRGLL